VSYDDINPMLFEKDRSSSPFNILIACEAQGRKIFLLSKPGETRRNEVEKGRSWKGE
jgi:hypothetical protein